MNCPICNKLMERYLETDACDHDIATHAIYYSNSDCSCFIRVDNWNLLIQSHRGTTEVRYNNNILLTVDSRNYTIEQYLELLNKFKNNIAFL